MLTCLVSAALSPSLSRGFPSILRGGGPRMMFNMFTEPKLIEPEKALPGREACASPASRRITHTYHHALLHTHAGA